MSYAVKLTPLEDRKIEIKNRVKTAKGEFESLYDYRTETVMLPVVELPIDLPVYRMKNRRTFVDQQSHIGNMELDSTYFEKGQERSEVQQVQHEILWKLAQQGTDTVTPIQEILKDVGQREVLLVSSSGVVVNGNRRLCAMRELLRIDDGPRDDRFEHVKCAVLPEDATIDDIDKIEARLQAMPEAKLDYDWIGDAQVIRQLVEKPGIEKSDVAKLLRRRPSEINNVLLALVEAELYLSEKCNAPRMYEYVLDGEQMFSDIGKQIQNLQPEHKKVGRAIAWAIYDNRKNVSGRVYRLNPAFGKLVEKVAREFEKQIKSSDFLERFNFQNPGDFDQSDDFEIDIDIDDGGERYERAVAALLNESTRDEAFSLLIDVIETEIETEKGKLDQEAALKTLGEVHAKLRGVNVSRAGVSHLEGMLKQVESIRTVLSKVENSISARLVKVGKEK